MSLWESPNELSCLQKPGYRPGIQLVNAGLTSAINQGATRARKCREFVITEVRQQTKFCTSVQLPGNTECARTDHLDTGALTGGTLQMRNNLFPPNVQQLSIKLQPLLMSTARKTIPIKFRALEG